MWLNGPSNIQLFSISCSWQQQTFKDFNMPHAHNLIFEFAYMLEMKGLIMLFFGIVGEAIIYKFYPKTYFHSGPMNLLG